MSYQLASDEYAQALRQGQKEYRELVMLGKNPHPEVLDELLPELLALPSPNMELRAAVSVVS